MRNRQIRRIVFAALFAALASIIKALSPETGDSRLSFFQIPIMLAGYYLGGGYGLAVGFVADTVYFLMPWTRGAFWGVFTISTMMWGLSGDVLRRIKPSLFNIIFVITLSGILETAINSFGLSIYLSGGWPSVFAGLSLRVVFMFIRIPINIVVIRYLIQRFEVMQLDFN